MLLYKMPESYTVSLYVVMHACTYMFMCKYKNNILHAVLYIHNIFMHCQNCN